MSDNALTCPSPEDFSAFHDGELSGVDRARVESHVASCADCAQSVARLQRASGLLLALPREEASDELVRAVAQRASRARRPGKWRLMAIPLVSAAAMLALSFFLLRMARERQLTELAPSALVARMKEADRSGPAAPPPFQESLGKKEQQLAAEAPAEKPEHAENADPLPADKLASTEQGRARRNQLEPAPPQEAGKDDGLRDADAAASATDLEADAREGEEKRAANRAREDAAFAPEPRGDLAANTSRAGRAAHEPQRQLEDAQRGAPVPASSAHAPAPAPMAKTKASAEQESVEGPASSAAIGGGIGGIIGGSAGRVGAELAQEPASPSTPIRIGPGVTPPVLIQRVEHDCPVPARRGVAQGDIILDCVVDERGAIRVERILKSVRRCDQVAINAVMQWRYQPAIFQGHPQAVHLIVRVPAFTMPR